MYGYQDQVANLQAYCRSVAAKVHGFGYDQKRLALDAFDVQVLLYRADHTPRWEIEAGIPLDSVQNRK